MLTRVTQRKSSLGRHGGGATVFHAVTRGKAHRPSLVTWGKGIRHSSSPRGRLRVP